MLLKYSRYQPERTLPCPQTHSALISFNVIFFYSCHHQFRSISSYRIPRLLLLTSPNKVEKDSWGLSTKAGKQSTLEHSWFSKLIFLPRRCKWMHTSLTTEILGVFRAVQTYMFINVSPHPQWQTRKHQVHFVFANSGDS